MKMDTLQPMRIRDFINILSKAIGDFTQPALLGKLCECAFHSKSTKMPTYVDNGQLESWLKQRGKTDRAFRVYFQDEDVVFNERLLLNFIRTRMVTTWDTVLLPAFNNATTKHLVNCATAERDVFLQSVVAQFREIAGVYDSGGVITTVNKLKINSTKIPKIDVGGFFKQYVPAKEFMNRDIPRSIFYNTIEGPPPYEQNVIMYYGIGGIGKSSLVKNLTEHTAKNGIFYMHVDFDDPIFRSPYKALIELKKQVGTTFPHFDLAVTLCFIKRNPELSYKDSGLPSELSYTVLKFLQSSDPVSMYNITDGLVEKVYHEFGDVFGLDESIKERLIALAKYSAAEIEEQLSVFFALDLYRHMIIKDIDRCVLFFDTYELLWEDGRELKLATDAWIRTIADLDMLGNVLFVLSGREKLQWELEDKHWDNQIQHIPLDVLEPEYAKQFLVVCGIDDDAIQSSIMETAQGHPYYLDLCVDTYYKLKNSQKTLSPSLFAGGFHKIQERFFRSLAKSEIDALRVLSVPRFYDYDLFDSINTRFQTGYALANFENFNNFSFIKHDEHSDRYIIHSIMRDEIKKHMDKNVRRSIDEFMVNYFESKLLPGKLPIDEIRYYFTELLYHLKSSESEYMVLSRIEKDCMKIIKRLQLSGETNYLLEHFLSLFNAHCQVLGGTEFFAVMVDMIHLSGDYRNAVRLITDYLDNFKIEKIATSEYNLGLYIRRTHHQMFYVHPMVLKSDLDKVLSFVDEERFVRQYCEIQFMLGAHIYLPMGDYENAAKHLKKTNSVAKQYNLHGLLCRGLRKFAEMTCACGNYRVAEKVCIAGLQFATENALWRYELYLCCVLSEVLRLTGRTNEAFVYLNEAMPVAIALGIKGWIAHINLALGNCHTDIGEFSQAQNYYDNADTIYDAIGQRWGEINLQTARLRMASLLSGKTDISALELLKEQSDALGYVVLSNSVARLMAGDKAQIRFEYL